MTTAEAHPNIALVKYWGKQELANNLPATPNISITLSALTTTTKLSDAPADETVLNGRHVVDEKITGFLRKLRAVHDFGGLRIETSNNFPTGAGLASSASGFAALITALNHHADLGMDTPTLSAWARQGSASAARSILPGFVSLAPPEWQAVQITSAEHWPLHTVIAVTSDKSKTVSSTAGMESSRKTSPYYDAWVHSSQTDFENALSAIATRDFNRLARIAELNCLKMHSVMLTSWPTLAYWNPATVACMDKVRTLRAEGTQVFFTIDAGPQVKAICLPEHATTVERAMNDTPGVIRTISSAIGDGARVIEL